MKSDQHMYCHYYQAHVQRELCWFVTAVLKSYEHIAFDRTINTAESRFEFFVAPSTEYYFLELMSYFQQEGLVSHLNKQPNRLAQESEQV
jgi:hypothetical protein